MSLKVSIVDTNAPDLKMIVSNFSLVEHFIQDEMYKLIWVEESASVSFQMKERFKGFRIINCDSEKSLNFLKSTVLTLAKCQIRGQTSEPVASGSYSEKDEHERKKDHRTSSNDQQGYPHQKLEASSLWKEFWGKDSC